MNIFNKMSTPQSAKRSFDDAKRALLFHSFELHLAVAVCRCCTAQVMPLHFYCHFYNRSCVVVIVQKMCTLRSVHSFSMYLKINVGAVVTAALPRLLSSNFKLPHSRFEPSSASPWNSLSMWKRIDRDGIVCSNEMKHEKSV